MSDAKREQFPRSLDEIHEAVAGCGNWTVGWLCDEESGALTTLFGADVGCTEDVVMTTPVYYNAAGPEKAKGHAPADWWAEQKQRLVALYFGTGPLPPSGLDAADLHITLAGGHCGKADCTRCDPMERYVDGLTVRECLDRYERMQGCDSMMVTMRAWGGEYAARWTLTEPQKAAAQQAWSAQLRTKLQQAEEKRRAEICVDDDRWEP